MKYIQSNWTYNIYGKEIIKSICETIIFNCIIVTSDNIVFSRPHIKVWASVLNVFAGTVK